MVDGLVDKKENVEVLEHTREEGYVGGWRHGGVWQSWVDGGSAGVGDRKSVDG